MPFQRLIRLTGSPDLWPPDPLYKLGLTLYGFIIRLLLTSANIEIRLGGKSEKGL